MKRDMLRSAAVAVLVLVVSGIHSRGGVAGELTEVSVALRPSMSLPDLSGQQRNLDEFAGKVVLVNFWASWCRPCIHEIPSIRRLAREMQDQPFTVIGVNVGEGQRRVQAAARRLEIDFTVLLDKDSAVFEGWGASILPTAYVLDRSGRVRYFVRGPLEWDEDEVIGKLHSLLAGKPPDDS